MSPADYLARFQLADLVLDTFPYNAGTTASDCLWAGTPIVGLLSGRSYMAGMCGSLLGRLSACPTSSPRLRPTTARLRGGHRPQPGARAGFL